MLLQTVKKVYFGLSGCYSSLPMPEQSPLPLGTQAARAHPIYCGSSWGRELGRTRVRAGEVTHGSSAAFVESPTYEHGPYLLRIPTS